MTLVMVGPLPVALWAPFVARPWYPCLPAARLRQQGGYLYPLPPAWRSAALRTILDVPRLRLALDGAPGAVEIVSCYGGEALRTGQPFARSVLLRHDGARLTLDPPAQAVSYQALEIEIVEDFGC